MPRIHGENLIVKYNSDIVTAVYLGAGLPAPVFEYRFHDKRKWRIDIAFPAQRLAVEVQGGIFIQGRHSRGAALLKEWEKLNTLACMGWRVMYCQPKDVCMSHFIEQIKTALRQAKSPPCRESAGAGDYMCCVESGGAGFLKV